MRSWEDERRDDLAERFPGWDVWFVNNPVRRAHTWCARPKGAPVAVFHSWHPDDLAAKLAAAEAAGKP